MDKHIAPYLIRKTGSQGREDAREKRAQQTFETEALTLKKKYGKVEEDKTNLYIWKTEQKHASLWRKLEKENVRPHKEHRKTHERSLARGPIKYASKSTSDESTNNVESTREDLRLTTGGREESCANGHFRAKFFEILRSSISATTQPFPVPLSYSYIFH